MRNFALFFFFVCFSPLVSSQSYDSSRVFAHNDYEGADAFHTSYDLQVGYIEADVFLQDGALVVAHTRNEIEPSRTLARLYLNPLSKALAKNGGFAFKDTTRRLTLMIDMKTEGTSTLNAIVEELKKYPSIVQSPTLEIMISGNVPDPSLWEQFPDFISFDGRPGIPYSDYQWTRIRMISTNFRSHAKWTGEGELPDDVVRKMNELKHDAHQHNKKFRFWATPDTENAWRQLRAANADVIVSDRVPELVAFLKGE